MHAYDAITEVASAESGTAAAFEPEAAGGAADLGGLADEAPSVKKMYEAEAYRQLGLTREQFNDPTFDPVIRNKLITRFYAGAYLDHPEDFKWAGMAAYGSQTVGEAMMEARLLEETPAGGLLGAPPDGALEATLASGNGGLFQQIGWQHVAFAQGGIEALQNAFIDGDLPFEQLLAWQRISDARKAREDGEGERADDLTWEGNLGLLSYEQNVFLQNRVYDGKGDMFSWLSANAPLRSPIPDGTSFQEAAGQDASLADPAARWGWVGGPMSTEWRDRDAHQRAAVLEDMERLRRIELPEGGAPDWYPE